MTAHSGAPPVQPITSKAFLRNLWRLMAPYWSSGERWPARGLLAVIVVMNLGLVYINVQLNWWNKEFYDALQQRNEGKFLSQLGIFAILATIYILVAVYRLYLNQMLQIRWRRWLTEHYISDWLNDRAYYRLQLGGYGTDNPDQRIADDLKFFVQYTLSLGLGLLSASVTLVSFIAILWEISGPLEFTLAGYDIVIPGYMVWVALIYSIVGTWLTHLIGRPLIRLNYNQQRFESYFRFGLVRLRENAEAIALYAGEDGERRSFRDLFQRVQANWFGIMSRQKRLTFFTVGF